MNSTLGYAAVPKMKLQIACDGFVLAKEQARKQFEKQVPLFISEIEFTIMERLIGLHKMKPWDAWKKLIQEDFYGMDYWAAYSHDLLTQFEYDILSNGKYHKEYRFCWLAVQHTTDDFILCGADVLAFVDKFYVEELSEEH